MSGKRNLVAPLLLLLLVSFRPNTARAEADGKLKFGLSVAGRTLIGNFEHLYSPAISPIDSTLHLDAFDRGAAVLSVSGVLFPWYDADDRCSSRFGFAVHANIATLDAVEANQTFNQTIEGGLGLAYRMGDHAALAVSWEKVRYRVPRKYVRDFEGRRIVVDGETLMELKPDDERFFRTDDMDAVSIRLIYFAN